MKIIDLIDTEKLEYKWDVIELIPEFAVLKTTENKPKMALVGNAGTILN